jgi:lysine 2,3-aminomutase
MLSPRRVSALMQALDAIPHVKIVRWHTRVPVVAPNLVTGALVSALTSGNKTVIVGIHANHPRELTPAARAALTRLSHAGIPLVSQSVLLRGINDDIATLDALMRAFVEARVIPYYLHHGDLAPGTGHFRIPVAHGIALVRDLHRRLSGIARPDYVLDLPGAFGKVSLLSADVRLTPDGCEIRDPAGCTHVYRDALP